MRVYTFTLPKFVSGFVRKCMVVFKKDEPTKTPTKNKSSKRKKQDKTPG